MNVWNDCYRAANFAVRTTALGRNLKISPWLQSGNLSAVRFLAGMAFCNSKDGLCSNDEQKNHPGRSTQAAQLDAARNRRNTANYDQLTGLSGRPVRSGWSENTRIRTDGSPAGVSGRFLKIIDTTAWTLKRSMMKHWANRNREELGAVIISIVVALLLANGFADPPFVIWKSPPSPALPPSVGSVGKSVSEIKNALELSQRSPPPCESTCRPS